MFAGVCGKRSLEGVIHDGFACGDPVKEFAEAFDGGQFDEGPADDLLGR